MKKFIFPSLSILLTSHQLSAQLGDFHLDSSSNLSSFRSYDTATANPDLKGGPLKNFFIGKNYRKEWRQPVRVPVLDFRVDLGGIKPKEEGGGRQTHSLELEDAQGRKWVLRSVRKYPEGVVPPELEGTIAEKIVADGISASHPYGVLPVGTLAKAAGVPFLPNTLVYIPDHPALGEFREKYKNSLSLLELRTVTTGEKKEKTYNTHEIIPELFGSAENRIDQRMVLKGRLLDNFIMDFDRHEGQWEWVKKDSAGRTYYYPVAKDRDQAFFRARGFIPRIARFIQPTLGQLQGFRAKTANINTFNFVAKDFDRSFLNELDEQAWNREIDAFLTSITDEVIEDAIQRQPKEILPFHGEKLVETLKEKRQSFKEDMMDYYRFLSKTVSVTGTNEKERFTITTDADGATLVQVEQIDSTGAAARLIYQRGFSPAVTKELSVYGLEGDDEFILRGSGNGITIRLIGGPGNDNFVSETGDGKALVYDVAYESNTLRGEGLKNKISDDPLNNEYRRLGAQYPVTLPFLGVELTREGGLFLGPTLKITRPGFRKEPYAAMHYLYATRAINSSSYHFRYNADFIGIAKKTDLLIRTDATLPTVRTYFFGFGNNTQYDKGLGRFYYLASYKLIDASVQARYSPTNWLQFTFGPAFQYLQLEDDRNRNKFVSTVMPPEGNATDLYSGQWFGGGEVRMQINMRNHPLLTTRGLHLNAYAKKLYRLGENASTYGQAGGNISLFTDILWRRVIVLGTSFGADRNFGSFAFPQAQYLGFRQNLRGYRIQRFAGRVRAYNNSEVRINLGVRNFYFFKGAYGLIGFHDIGRVWLTGESSDTWHSGYGGGLWVAPFNKLVVVGTLATSKEENNWLQVSFGFQF
jgi:hypothetical protein